MKGEEVLEKIFEKSREENRALKLEHLLKGRKKQIIKRRMKVMLRG